MGIETDTDLDLDAFTVGYLEAALLSAWDGEGEVGTIDDIDAHTLRQMIQDCRDFQEQNAANLKLYDQDGIDHEVEPEKERECDGTDFFAIRNRGGGFYARGDQRAGENLREAAAKWGPFALSLSKV